MEQTETYVDLAVGGSNVHRSRTSQPGLSSTGSLTVEAQKVRRRAAHDGCVKIKVATGQSVERERALVAILKPRRGGALVAGCQAGGKGNTFHGDDHDH